MSASRPNNSRFANTESLKTVFLLMESLYKKEVELAKDAKLKNNDPNSIDYKKYVVVSDFITKVNNLIDQFNAKPEPVEITEQWRHIVIFATALQEMTKDTLEKHSQILQEPRNEKRKNANIATQGAILSAAGLFAVTQTFATGVAALAFGYQGSVQLKEITGLTDTDPASYRWIKGLNNIATNICNNAKRRIAAQMNLLTPMI